MSPRHVTHKACHFAINAPHYPTRRLRLVAETPKEDRGFPVQIEGRFPQLVWHVVTGDAPARGGHGAGHGGGHANSQSGMNLYDEAGAAGEIIGVYTGATLEGIASHPG